MSGSQSAGRRVGPVGVVGWLLVGWLRVVWAVVRRPILSVPLGVFVVLSALVGTHDGSALMIYAAVGLWVWRRLHRESFDRLVGRWLRPAWRRLWVYDRHWRPTMVLCGLGKHYGVREAVPRIRAVQSSRWGDRVLVSLVRGQSTEDIENVAAELAHSFGAQSCRVREDGPGRLWLEFATGDALEQLVPALAIPETVDLDSVAVGRQEDGQPWRLRVRGTHLLIAGATGAGKGSVLWSLIRGVAPAIRDRLVEVWAIDPKGGMELGPGRGLFSRFEGGEFEAMADLLDQAVAVMDERARRMAGVTRLHQPRVGEPLILIVVDEIATLTAYLPDRKLKDRIARSLGLLLTKGRAVGVCVIAALQDPRKEVLGFRGLFSARVGLRLDEPMQIDMVLGDGARQMGARCDRIPARLPGVGYVRIDGIREPIRIRAGYVTDADIAAMVAQYAPGRPAGEALFDAAERAAQLGVS